jgi:hypothetical protein
VESRPAGGAAGADMQVNSLNYHQMGQGRSIPERRAGRRRLAHPHRRLLRLRRLRQPQPPSAPPDTSASTSTNPAPEAPLPTDTEEDGDGRRVRVRVRRALHGRIGIPPHGIAERLASWMRCYSIFEWVPRIGVEERFPL